MQPSEKTLELPHSWLGLSFQECHVQVLGITTLVLCILFFKGITNLGKGARSFDMEKRKLIDTNMGLRSSRKAREKEVGEDSFGVAERAGGGWPAHARLLQICESSLFLKSTARDTEISQPMVWFELLLHSSFSKYLWSAFHFPDSVSLSFSFSLLLRSVNC